MKKYKALLILTAYFAQPLMAMEQPLQEQGPVYQDAVVFDQGKLYGHYEDAKPLQDSFNKLCRALDQFRSGLQELGLLRAPEYIQINSFLQRLLTLRDRGLQICVSTSHLMLTEIAGLVLRSRKNIGVVLENNKFTPMAKKYDRVYWPLVIQEHYIDLQERSLINASTVCSLIPRETGRLNGFRVVPNLDFVDFIATYDQCVCDFSDLMFSWVGVRATLTELGATQAITPPKLELPTHKKKVPPPAGIFPAHLIGLPTAGAIEVAKVLQINFADHILEQQKAEIPKATKIQLKTHLYAIHKSELSEQLKSLEGQSAPIKSEIAKLSGSIEFYKSRGAAPPIELEAEYCGAKVSNMKFELAMRALPLVIEVSQGFEKAFDALNNYRLYHAGIELQDKGLIDNPHMQ